MANGNLEPEAIKTDTASIVLYTDGACSGNPGLGGWGALLRYGQHEKELSGSEQETTNNRMELMGVIGGLRALKRPCSVAVYTDSQYVRQGMLTWMENWKKNGWRNSKKEPVKNQDLWKQLDELASQHQIEWHWVKGHAGNPDNERVDALATAAIKRK